MAKNKFKKPAFKKWILLLWTIFVLPFIGLLVVMTCAANGWLGFPPLPSLEELENPKSNLASEIITDDGIVIGKYFKENRVNVNYEDLSPYLVDALVATEDERYREHSGIDFRGLMRAVLNFGKAGGASTITQNWLK